MIEFDPAVQFERCSAARLTVCLANGLDPPVVGENGEGDGCFREIRERWSSAFAPRKSRSF